MKKAIGIGLLGLGTVGSRVAELLVTKADSLAGQAGLSFPAREKGVQKALKQLRQLPEVDEVSNFIRVEG